MKICLVNHKSVGGCGHTDVHELYLAVVSSIIICMQYQHIVPDMIASSPGPASKNRFFGAGPGFKPRARAMSGVGVARKKRRRGKCESV